MKKLAKVLAGIVGVVAVLAIAYFALVNVRAGEAPESIEGTNPYIVNDDEAAIVAHRSGGGEFPENTMRAFESVVNNEGGWVDVLEMDVQITADGKLVLLHDDTLDRTTDSTDVFGVADAKVCDYTYEELRQLNFGEGFQAEDGSYPYAGLRNDAVPDDLRATLLEDVLDYLQGKGDFDYIIEIKDSDELGYAATDELYRILIERDLLDDVVVGTFNSEITEYFDSEYPDMMRSAGVTDMVGLYVDALLGIDREPGYYAFDAMEIPMSYYGQDLAEPYIVNHAHKANVAVRYWTINDEDEMRYLIGIGADAIISDYPSMVNKVLEEL